MMTQHLNWEFIFNNVLIYVSDDTCFSKWSTRITTIRKGGYLFEWGRWSVKIAVFIICIGHKNNISNNIYK